LLSPSRLTLLPRRALLSVWKDSAENLKPETRNRKLETGKSETGKVKTEKVETGKLKRECEVGRLNGANERDKILRMQLGEEIKKEEFKIILIKNLLQKICFVTGFIGMIVTIAFSSSTI
jgi:hypothetical protein